MSKVHYNVCVKFDSVLFNNCFKHLLFGTGFGLLIGVIWQYVVFTYTLYKEL